MAVCDLYDPLGDPVDEISVMGNDYNSSLECIDITLQPLHTAKIQVVCRLIQQQNIRFFQQEPGKIDTGLLSPGKAVKFLLALLPGNPQAVTDLIGFYIRFIAASCLKRCSEPVIFPEKLTVRS